MKISEAIKELKDILQENGDCMIYCNQAIDFGYDIYTKCHLPEIEYQKGKVYIYKGEYVKTT